MTKASSGRATATDRPSAKKRRSRAFSWVLALLSALAVLTLFAVRREGELELAISLDKDRAYQGDPILMTLSVENVSRRAVEADKWASVGPDECMTATGLPVELTLYDASRTAPRLQLAPEPGNLGPGPLPPGAKMEMRCNIAEYFALVKPGKYVLEGGYFRDRWARRSYLRLAARLWASLVEHDPLPFEVVARPYDDPSKM